MTFFPQVPHPDPAAMNWSIVVFGSVVVFSVLYFLVRGRHQYAGPVAYVKKDL
jgi:choline transport protein